MYTLDPATQVNDAIREEAKRNPNGWVYMINSSYVVTPAL